MALINLPGGCWIDIPSKGYKIDYGEKDGTVLERGISDNRVVELLRDFDDDEPYIYSVEERIVDEKEWLGMGTGIEGEV